MHGREVRYQFRLYVSIAVLCKAAVFGRVRRYDVLLNFMSRYKGIDSNIFTPIICVQCDDFLIKHIFDKGFEDEKV